jgi:hypothetical protein
MVKAGPMPFSSGAIRKLLILLVLLVSVSFASCRYSAYAVEEVAQSPSGIALYIKTPAVSDFGHVSRDISIPVRNGSDYLVELWVKVMRFSTFPAGVFFVFDLIDGAGAVRFSIRLTSDRSVMFYYPFGESSAVFTAREAWHPSWWYGYSIRLHGSVASFYVNGTSVGTSESTGLEAVGGGFNLARVRLGEVDAGNMVFEGFIDSLLIVEDGLPIFFEGFEEGLGSYEVSKSEEATVNLLSASAFTTLTLIVDPRSFSSGGSTTLLGWLKDSGNLGVANRTVYFEYDLGDGTWVLLGSTFTGADGAFKYVWKVPVELKGSIEVRAKFQGDEAYATSTSQPVELSIKPQPRFTLDYRYLVLLLLIGLFAGILVIKRKVGLADLLSSCFLLVGAFFTFFSILIVANSLQLAYYLAYQRRVIEIAIFSSGEDFSLWLGSLACLVVLPQLFGYILRMKQTRSFAVVYLILLVAVAFRFLGFDGASIGLAVLAGLTTLFIGIWRSKDALSIGRRKALLIYFVGFLLILLPIELGSSLAWLYNSFDPHYPFDNDSRWILPSVETQFFNIAYGATPLLLLMLLFAWILIPILKTAYLRSSRRLGSAVFSDRRESSEEKNRFSAGSAWLESITRFGPKAILFLSFLLGVYMVYYPYFYEKRLLGVDTAHFYYPKLLEMNDWRSVTVILISEARAPYLLLLFFLKIATGLDPIFIVKIGPALPAVLLALSSYIFLRVATRDEWLAAFGSILSSFSIHTTVGMFAGIFTNWLAMSEVMLFFASLLKGSEAGYRSRWAILTAVMGFLLLFTHGWTWGVVMAITAAYLLFTVLRWRLEATRRFELRRESLFAFVVLAFCTAPILLVFLALPLIPSSVGAIAAVSSGYTEVLSSMSLSYLGNVWTVVVFTVTYYVGGFFGNPMIYLLGFLGAFRLLRVGSCSSRILFSWLALISAGSVLMDSWYQWRLLYLLPFQVFALFGLQMLVDMAGSFSLDVRRAHKGERSSLLFELLLALIILLSLFNYALRSLNYLIPS